jgi:uncharacterized Zn finger protein
LRTGAFITASFSLRIVFGVRNSKVREKFINIGSDLTLEKTLEIARRYEIPKSQTKCMDLETGHDKIHAVKGGHYQKHKSKEHAAAKPQKPTNPSYKMPKCTRCGRVHKKDQCPAIGQQCAKCNKFDHFAAVFRTKMGPAKQKRVPHKPRSKQVNQIESDSDSSCEFYVGMVIELSNENYNVNSLKTDWLVNAEIKGMPLQMQIDTGACCNVMSTKTLEKLGLHECTESTEKHTMY